MKEIRDAVQKILQPLKRNALKVCGNCDETFTVSLRNCPQCARVLSMEEHSLLWSYGDWRVWEVGGGDEYAVQHMPLNNELCIRGSDGIWWFFPTATQAFRFQQEARKRIEHGE